MRTIIDLPSDQIADLKSLSERLNLSRAELVRRAATDYVARHRRDPDDVAFGLWKHRAEDGLTHQTRLRSEWNP